MLQTDYLINMALCLVGGNQTLLEITRLESKKSYAYLVIIHLVPIQMKCEIR